MRIIQVAKTFLDWAMDTFRWYGQDRRDCRYWTDPDLTWTEHLRREADMEAESDARWKADPPHASDGAPAVCCVVSA